MAGAFRVGRIAGIDISIHYTWLFAFLLVTWTLAGGFFPAQFPDWGVGLNWVAGAVSALLLFGSVLVHELAHSFMAKARGLPVHGITLFIFGGVSSIGAESRKAGDEFAVSVVGPLTSLVIAGGCWLLAQPLAENSLPGAVVRYLAFVNVLLAGFNLLPGFPLDGGRVLRAAIWGATGNFTRATSIAAGVGQAFGFLMISWGVFRIFSGDLLGGMWTAFIGWFLNSAADASRQEAVARESFGGVRVRDLMDPRPDSVPPDTPVAALVQDFILKKGSRAVPVCRDGRLVGLVSVSDVRDLDQERWPSTPVESVMTREPLYTVRPDAGAGEALRVLAEQGINQVLVTEGDVLLGLLTRAHLVQYLQFRAELGIRPRQARETR